MCALTPSLLTLCRAQLEHNSSITAYHHTPILLVRLVQPTTASPYLSLFSASMSAVSLLFVGNPGGGKSFLGNTVLGEQKFSHERSGAPVTLTHEEATVQLSFNGQPRTVTVHNVPGFIHPGDPAETEKNKAAIADAFSKPGDHIIGYCFAVGSGGRMVDQDYNVYNALKNAYDFQSTAVLFIFNKLDKLRNVNEDAKIVIETKAVLDWPAGQPFYAVFITDVGKVVTNFSDANTDIQPVKQQLFSALQQLVPTRHEKHGEIQLANEAELKALSDKIAAADKKAQDAEGERAKISKQMEDQKAEMDKLRQAAQGGGNFWDEAGKFVANVGKTILPFF